MSTMPTREQFPDFMQYLRASQEWDKTDEGIAYAAEQKRKAEERERLTQAAFEAAIPGGIKSILVGLGIPSRALAAIYGAIEKTSAIGASEGSTDFLVLSGGPGCGKTVAAAAWVRDYVATMANWRRDDTDYTAVFRGPKPIWVTAAKLARWDRYEEEQMTKLLRTPRLVIDDLGGEYLDKGGFYASLLDEIVNERQAESRPTIMTTNLNVAAFKERYGERITDRIREGGRFVGCGDHSLRKRAA